MNMTLFKEKVKEMKYTSLKIAFKDLSKLKYLRYVRRTESKFIFELENGEIFTMDNEEIIGTFILNEHSYDADIIKIRIAPDWKKVETYDVLDEVEKFNFIKHEFSLEKSLETLLKLTNRTKGKFSTQRELIDEIAIIYGYLKRKGNAFEIYLGTNYECCSIVELSIQRARLYYKLYHHLHQRDNFQTDNKIDEYKTLMGKETFETLKINFLKETNSKLSIELNNNKIETNTIIKNQNLEIKKLKNEIEKMNNKKGFISRIFGL